MFNYFRKELDWGGRKLILETGKIARQADGAVLASYGDTIVLCTAVGVKQRQARPGFLPADGQLPGKDLRRGQDPRRASSSARAGPSEKEMLVTRLIDRPIRPLFPEGFRNEVQVIATVLSHDLENDPDIVAMVGCSAALTLSGIPFLGPIAAARVGYIDGQYVLNPTVDADGRRRSSTGRRRHRRRRADGGMRGEGTVRGRHARRRHLRPRSTSSR